jgi:hypothetical protein
MDNENGVTSERRGGSRDYLSLGMMLWGGLGLAFWKRLEINKYLPRGRSTGIVGTISPPTSSRTEA